MYPTSLVTDTAMCTIIRGVSVECIELVAMKYNKGIKDGDVQIHLQQMHHALTCIGSKCYIKQLELQAFFDSDTHGKLWQVLRKDPN